MELQAAVDQLRAEFGLDFTAARRVLCRLAKGRPVTVSALVAATGASRRTVTELLERLDPWVKRVDGGYLLTEDADLRFDRPDLSEARLATLLEQVTEVVASRPPARWALDHVPATPDTVVRRAHALAANYDLVGRHLLCLGDHDLTSVALALLLPEADVTVVDLDEMVLDYVGAIAAKHGLNIRTVFADLRAELPPSLAQAVDLVFTDPPYTPAGIELFLARGLAALRRHPANRVLFCYSPNDRQPARAVAVQDVLARLRLAIEAVVPDFNVFSGAESLGGRSALWVCQPTPTTWPALRRHRPQQRIYTRGQHAEETHAEETHAEETHADILQRHAASEPAAVALPADRLLRAEPPAGQGGTVPPGGVLLVDLTALHASYVHRILFRVPAVRRAVFAVSERDLRRTGLRDPESPVRRLLSAQFTLAFPAEPDRPPDLAVVVADAVPAADVPEELSIARYVLGHPKATLASAWREALIVDARRRGEPLTKNDARRIIAAHCDVGMIAGRYLGELPAAALSSVAAAIAAGVGRH